VVEWDGLENRLPTCRYQGSNPCLSAKTKYFSEKVHFVTTLVTIILKFVQFLANVKAY